MSQSSTIRDLLESAAVDVGRMIHRVRVVFLALVFVRLLLFVGPQLLAGTFKHTLTTGFMAGGVVLSFGVLKGLERSTRRRPWLLASTLLDSLLALLIILPSVLWPREAYLGLLRSPDILVFPIIAIAAGFYMSRTIAVTGGLAAVGGLGLLVGLDLTRNASIVRYGGPEILLAAVLLVGAIIVSVGLVVFVERLLVRTADETERAQGLRQQFGSYVAEEFAQIVLAPGVLKPRRCEVAVLFSDLRGFTRFSEQADPDALITALNGYFEAVVDAVRAEGGVVDKYIGDALMVVFGLPEPSGEDASRAIRAAVAMRKALDAHNQVRISAGAVPLAQGIGVHFGEVVAGPVGTSARRQYTVLGDTVNVAARLESATKDSPHDLLISGAAMARAQQEGGRIPELREYDQLVLRGREGSVGTWCLPPETP